MSTPHIVPNDAPASGAGQRPAIGGVLPIAVIGAALLAATWWYGAFELRRWGPLALLVLLTLAGLVAGGSTRLPRRGAALALSGMWGLVAWTLLSATWAESPERALDGAAQTALFAGLATLPLVIAVPPRLLRRLAVALALGVGVVAAVTLVALLADGHSLFLAGRLDDPIGYRNGTAALFAFGMPPLLCFAAMRGRHPLARGLCLGLAALELGLVFLTQSRGGAGGVAIGIAAILVLGPDRVRRLWLALVVVVAVAATSGSLLTPYHEFTAGLAATDAALSTAVGALLVLTLATVVVGVVLAAIDDRLDGEPRAVLGALAVLGSFAVALVAVVAVLVAVGNPVSFADRKFDEFRSLDASTTEGTTRLTAAGGQRYDLWRIALDEFSGSPLGGVGEGGYQVGYYQDRRTDRNLSDPHGLPFRLLAETGLVGALLFAAFLAGLVWQAASRWRRAERGARVVAAGLIGACVTMLLQTSVDWLWSIPGLMGLAFLAAGLAVAQLAPDGEHPEAESGGELHETASDADHRRGPAAARSPWLGAGAAALLVALAAGVTLLFLSDLYVRRGEALGSHPAQRLSAARTAHRLNPWALPPEYLRASALEALGNRAAARTALDDALRREPRNFATLGVLGDLELRAGRPGAARAYYRRASALNPIDVGLRQLASGEPDAAARSP